jgi:hypothetical protein
MSDIPLKAMVAQCFNNCEALNAKAVYDLVRDHYPDEKYCSIPVIEEQLLSLKVVGILNEEGSYLDDDNRLVSVYRISEYGLDKLHRAG